MKIPNLMAVVLAAGIVRLAAQGTPSASPASSLPPLPPGPPVAKRAANFARWTITTTPGKRTGGDSKNAEQSTVTEITKTGDVWHINVRSQGGTKGDIWASGMSQVTIRPEWKEPLLSSGENRYDAARVDFSRTDFEDFEWVSAADYAGIVKISGRDCIIYKAKVPAYQVDPVEKAISGVPVVPKIETTAYVDFDTRLPVALVTESFTKAFKFGDAPTEKLTLPPEAQKSIDAWSKKKQLLLRKPSQP